FVSETSGQSSSGLAARSSSKRYVRSDTSAADDATVDLLRQCLDRFRQLLVLARQVRVLAEQCLELVRNLDQHLLLPLLVVRNLLAVLVDRVGVRLVAVGLAGLGE